VGDLGRAVMLASIPIAYVLDVLTIWQLFVVAFGNGILTVFFDIADQSYLPTVVERDELIDGNAKLQASMSTAMAVGQPVGGGIVGLLTAPFAILLDALSFVASALLIFAIRRPERATAPTPAAAAASTVEAADAPSSGSSAAAESVAAGTLAGDAPPEPGGMRREVSEGLRFVGSNRYLRSIAPTTALGNLFNNLAFAVLPVFAYRDIGITPEVVGLIGGAAGLGAIMGAATAGRIASRIGVGPAIAGSSLVAAPTLLLVPFATRDTALLLIGGAEFVAMWANVVYNVNQVSLRQAITPERMLGRMNATMRFIVWGTIPIGQIVGGVIATLFGVITAIWVGAIGALFAFLPVFFSPVRSLRTIPDPEPEPGAGTEAAELGAGAT
jgi:predicted MFS family arabinose efflux permease